MNEPDGNLPLESQGDEIEGDRHPVELLAEEFTERLRRGEGPTVEEYEAEHPEWAEEIRDAFPAIAAVEGYKAGRRSSSDGRATLGGARLERLGDFRIVREIGRGGMGVVFEAVQESLKRRVAVKVLPRQSLIDPVHLQRFQREAQMAAGLHHTNIVPVFGVGEQDGFHYYVMQFIDGVGLDRILGDLRLSRGKDVRGGAACGPPDRPSLAAVTTRRIVEDSSVASVPLETSERPEGSDPVVVESPPASEAPPLPLNPVRLARGHWQSVARIGLQAAEALQYAHSQGVLHRDVKPANLMVDSHGVVWVTDFGLAKAMEHDGISQTGDIVGTLRYMAPEQLVGEGDARSDIYSLGLSVYEMLTLQPAYEDTRRSQLIRKISESNPMRPRKSRGDIPRDLETIAMKAIARDPGHRYATAGDLAWDLRAFLEDRPIRARRTYAVVRLWRWARRNQATALATSAALVLLVLVAIVASAGYVSTQRAMESEAEFSALASAALDRIFDKFAPNRATPTSDVTVEGTEGEEIEVPVQPVLSKEAATLLEELLIFYRRLAEQSGNDVRLLKKTAEASRRVGDIRQRLGQIEEARKAYEAALVVYEDLRSSDEAPGAIAVEMARIHNELGKLRWLAEEPGDASYRVALSILESIQGTDWETPDSRFELARTCYLLGRDPFRETAPAVVQGPPGPPPGGGRPGARGDENRAGGEGWRGRQGGGSRRGPGAPDVRALVGPREESLQRAVDILEELVVEFPRVPDYRALLGRAYRELPPWPRESQAESTTNPLDRAVEILTELVAEFPDVPDYRYDLCEAYAAVGPPEPPGRRPGLAAPEPKGTTDGDVRAFQWLTEALRISESLVAEHPNVPDYVTSQVRIRHKLSRLLVERQQLDDALEMISRTLVLQRGLVARFPGVDSYPLWLAVLEESLARVHLARGKPEEAVIVLEGLARRLEESSDDSRRTAFLFQLFRVRTYFLLSEAQRSVGNGEAALEAEQRARELRGHLPPFGAGQRGRGAAGRSVLGPGGPEPSRPEPSRRMWIFPPPAGLPPFDDATDPEPAERAPEDQQPPGSTVPDINSPERPSSSRRRAQDTVPRAANLPGTGTGEGRSDR